jgi:drug/metabolite transporter (DMT)-like permease
MKWLFIVLTVCMSSAGDVLCAAGMSQGAEVADFHPRGIVRILRFIVTQRRIILGGLCYAAAFVALLGLLSSTRLSVAIPATALSFVLDTIAARFLLREHVPWKRWAGVVLVCIGVYLTVRPTSTGPAGLPSTPVQAHQDQPRHHQRRPRQLDRQSAAAEVLREP